MRKIIILLILLTGHVALQAQIVNDLVLNRKNFNPAFTAPTKDLTIDAQLNAQRLVSHYGIWGTYLTAEKYFPKIKSGFGIEGGFQQNTILNTYYGKLYYNYRHYFTDDFMIAAGTSIGINRIEYDDFYTNDPIVFPSEPIYYPILNIGAMTKIKKHTIGISCNQLIGMYFYNSRSNIKNFNLFYSYRIKLNDRFALTPGVYDILYSGFHYNVAGIMADLSYKNMINAGFILSNGNQRSISNCVISGYASALISGRIRIGYGFDFRAYKAISSYYASHYFRLGVLLGKK